MATATGGPVYEEVIVFDSEHFENAGMTESLNEGLARRLLGLLDENGKPLTDEDGNLLPLVSQDGTRAAFDMRGGNGVSFKDAVGALNQGGTLTILTHGNTGLVILDGTIHPGFGEGTGLRLAGDPDPYQLDGVGAKTGITVNMVVCRAAQDDGNQDVTSVADSLVSEIESLGGTVVAVRAGSDTRETEFRLNLNPREAVGNLTDDQRKQLGSAVQQTLADLPNFDFDEHHMVWQQRLDGIFGEGVVTAVVEYFAEVSGTTLGPEGGESPTEGPAPDGSGQGGEPNCYAEYVGGIAGIVAPATGQGATRNELLIALTLGVAIIAAATLLIQRLGSHTNVRCQ